MQPHSQHIASLLKSIKTINYYANEFVEDKNKISFDTFLSYYQDYKTLITSSSNLDTETKSLINELPNLYTYKTIFFLAGTFYAVFMMALFPYIFLTLPIGLLLFYGIYFWMNENRKSIAREIININNEIYNLLFKFT